MNYTLYVSAIIGRSPTTCYPNPNTGCVSEEAESAKQKFRPVEGDAPAPTPAAGLIALEPDSGPFIGKHVTHGLKIRGRVEF
ncbi:hypothetical protein TNIN_140671 [Trichonephila inaurata madagascariensis]|uniref:Uncharacterized protein n=1 Tax=Trichonephila inaurata madagascariensis TaxID=2747483 RepID=A0A8X6YTV0_9ARAC|nr:hypothetical protein TNIN_140671 [Trichonephila inaurata madagascariensis]